MPERLITFRGMVSCVRSAGVPGFALAGRSAERDGEPTTLVFPVPAPADLPQTLQDAWGEQLAPREFRIGSAAGAWRITAATAEVHAEVADAFYRAVPPRAVPWTKRLFWSVVLRLAASRAGLAALRRLRG